MDPIQFSEARARLPELVHRVARHPGEVVVIRHRDLAEHVALVSLAHLRGVEERLAELRGRLGPPFQLAGAFTTVLTDNQLDAAFEALQGGRSPVAPDVPS
jgi:hypothetical protein